MGGGTYRPRSPKDGGDARSREGHETESPQSTQRERTLPTG